jgi:hypothetical protein
MLQTINPPVLIRNVDILNKYAVAEVQAKITFTDDADQVGQDIRIQMTGAETTTGYEDVVGV